jgi:hypothetical protein
VNSVALSAGRRPDAAQQARKVLAVEVLHRKEVQAVHETDVVHAAHVGVADLAGDADFVAEAGEGGFVELLLGEEFEGDGLIEDEVEGLVDLAHAALAQESEDSVASGENGACGEAAFVGGGGGSNGRVGEECLSGEFVGGGGEFVEAGGADEPVGFHGSGALGTVTHARFRL